MIQLHRLLGAVRYLFGQLRELVEVVVLTGERVPRLLCCQTRHDEVQTVLDLLEEVIQPVPTSLQKEVQRVIKQVRLALPALLYFAEQVEASQQEAIEQLGAPAVGLIAWAWQRRKILGVQPQQLLAALDPAWREPASHLLQAWNQAVRASSVVENWHNHRVAPRGLHKGLSPLQRSGLQQPTVDWLEVLGYVAPAA